MHSITGVDLQHPSYCDPGRCTSQGSALHHRSVEALFIPRQRDTTEAASVRITAERLDDVDTRTGEQDIGPDEAVLEYRDARGELRRVRWGISDFQEVAGLILDLAESRHRVAVAS